MTAPCLLAFDTSTETAHLALLTSGGLQGRSIPAGAQTSHTLLPALQSLCQAAGGGLDQLDAIAYGAGPGAFTGLRSACAVAQGLAVGLGRPVLALDTLMAVAEHARRLAGGPEDFEVMVANDARMQQAYAAVYRHAKAGWTTLQAARLVDLVDLPGWLATQPDAAGAGSALRLIDDERGRAAHWPHAVPDPAALATLALAAWQQGRSADAATAQPVYVRDRVAWTHAERAAAKEVR